jgi:hypothetical protein
MSRSLGKSQVSSLELLLDTICNMFGSIILITLLIVITTNESPIEKVNDNQEPNREDLARRIHTANLQIENLEKQISMEQANRSSLPSENKRIESLREQIKSAESTLKESLSIQTSAIEMVSPRSSETLKSFQDRIRNLQSRISELENQIDTEQRRHPELQAELKRLETNRKELAAQKTENLRLPKSRETTKKPSFVICIHGEIYPLRLYDPAGEVELFPGIEARKVSPSSTSYIPKPGKGLPNSLESVRAAFKYTPNNRYLACYVFPDSVDAFRRLRKALEDLPIEIGWDPEETGESITLTTEAGIPAPRPQ